MRHRQTDRRARDTIRSRSKHVFGSSGQSGTRFTIFKPRKVGLYRTETAYSWTSLVLLHYHTVLRPEGTSHNYIRVGLHAERKCVVGRDWTATKPRDQNTGHRAESTTIAIGTSPGCWRPSSARSARTPASSSSLSSSWWSFPVPPAPSPSADPWRRRRPHRPLLEEDGDGAALECSAGTVCVAPARVVVCCTR